MFAGLPARRLAINYTLAGAARPKSASELLILHPAIAAAHPTDTFVIHPAHAA